MHKPRLLWAGLLLEKKLFWCTMIVRMDISYIRVAAGTKNTLKLGAISNAFYKAGLFIEMEGHDVPSDVPKQPFTRSEVREGARDAFWLLSLAFGEHLQHGCFERGAHLRCFGCELERGVACYVERRNRDTERRPEQGSGEHKAKNLSFVGLHFSPP